MQIAHSAYPDSPLGPDAYREYESLLVQDYEELTKRCDTNSLKENATPEDEGWSQLTSSEDDISHFVAPSGAGDPYEEDDRIGQEEDLGQKLAVSVHHFPLVLSPFSPRVFVLPSEGSVAEACLSAQHENSVSAGLPPLSSGAPSDGEDVSPGATLTAQFLYHLAAKVLNVIDTVSLVNLYCY